MADYLFSPFAGMMRCKDICPNGALALAYRIEDDSSDPWTERVNRVKFPRAGSTLKSRAAAASVLAKCLSEIQFPAKSLGVTAALGHNDRTMRNGSALSQIGQSLASQLSLPWLPALLSREPTGELKQAGSPNNRFSMLHEKYTAIVCHGHDGILLLDDFSTVGTTLREITRAVKASNPLTKVIGILLGKNETRSYWAGKGVNISNDHIPQAMADLWDATERG